MRGFKMMGRALVLVSILGLSTPTQAMMKPERLDLGWGHFYHGRGLTQMLRVAADWPFRSFVKKPTWWFGGYWQLSASNWHTDWVGAYGHSEQILALSPVFRLQYKHFYWDFGVGASLVSKTRFSDRCVTSHGHFEDRMGWGFTFGPEDRYQIGYLYIHYSNAGLAKPNNGLDVQTVQLGFRI